MIEDIIRDFMRETYDITAFHGSSSIVAVTENGNEVLNKASKETIIIKNK